MNEEVVANNIVSKSKKIEKAKLAALQMGAGRSPHAKRGIFANSEFWKGNSCLIYFRSKKWQQIFLDLGIWAFFSLVVVGSEIISFRLFPWMGWLSFLCNSVFRKLPPTHIAMWIFFFFYGSSEAIASRFRADLVVVELRKVQFDFPEFCRNSCLLK